jgi:hypothetical protein
MLRGKLVFVVTFLTLFSLIRPVYGGGPTFTIDEIVEAIKLEIMGAQAIEGGSPRIRISTFSLTLSVIASQTSKGVIEFLVPGTVEGASRGFSTSATHTISINMTVSEEVSVTPLATTLGLLPAIQNVRSALRDAYTSQPVFPANSLSFTIEFAIVKGDKQDYLFRVIEAEKPEYKNFVTHRLTIQMSVMD